MTEVIITSDTHFGFTHADFSHFASDHKRGSLLAELIERRIEQMGITHRIYRPVKKSFTELPEGAKGPPTTIHRIIHVGDFI